MTPSKREIVERRMKNRASRRAVEGVHGNAEETRETKAGTVSARATKKR
jgi:hypothetical protein